MAALFNLPGIIKLYRVRGGFLQRQIPVMSDVYKPLKTQIVKKMICLSYVSVEYSNKHLSSIKCSTDYKYRFQYVTLILPWS